MDKAEALTHITNLMVEHSIHPKEVKLPRKKGYKLPPKYSDGTNTWSGRGLVPKWLKDKDLEQFKIAK